MKKRTMWTWTLALVATVALFGCSSSESEGETADPSPVGADDPADDDSGASPPADAIGDPATAFGDSAVYDLDAELMLRGGAPYDPGTYRTGAIGTPMSFTIAERLSTQANGVGSFVLTDIASRAPDDRDLSFLRAANFTDPAAPNAPIDTQTPWPGDDFRGWLQNLHEGVTTTEPVETTVNGLPALTVDLALNDEIECGFLPGACVGLLTNNGQDIRALNRDATYRIWVVDQAGYDPLVVIAAVARDDDMAWFDRAFAVLDTVGFGEPAPNPVQWLTPGPARLNVLGGIDVELPDDIAELTNGRPRVMNAWAGRGFALIPITERPGAVYFADRLHDLDGNLLLSVDEVLDELAAGGVLASERDAVTVDGIAARVFDLTADRPGAIVMKFSSFEVSEERYGWDAPEAGRMWLIEHPERGLLMINGQAFAETEAMSPVVNELAEAIVASMTFGS